MGELGILRHILSVEVSLLKFKHNKEDVSLFCQSLTAGRPPLFSKPFDPRINYSMKYSLPSTSSEIADCDKSSLSFFA